MQIWEVSDLSCFEGGGPSIFVFGLPLLLRYFYASTVWGEVNVLCGQIRGRSTLSQIAWMLSGVEVAYKFYGAFSLSRWFSVIFCTLLLLPCLTCGVRITREDMGAARTFSDRTFAIWRKRSLEVLRRILALS